MITAWATCSACVPALQQLGLEAVVTADADTIRAADRLILPGVGAFGDAMDKLVATGLVPVMKGAGGAKAPAGHLPWACSCCLKKATNTVSTPGLGFIQGEVCPLEPDLADKSLKVPQMGWNALHIVKDDPLFRYIREGEYVYYVHSYYGKNCAESTLAVSDYSIPVTGVVRAGRVYGTQFHPEKERRHRAQNSEGVQRIVTLSVNACGVASSPRGELSGHCRKLFHCTRHYNTEGNGVRPLSQTLRVCQPAKSTPDSFLIALNTLVLRLTAWLSLRERVEGSFLKEKQLCNFFQPLTCAAGRWCA